MSKRFIRDKIENENEDAIELSSMRYVIVPLMMISALLGFGITYLVLQTPDMQLSDGDSRVKEENTIAELQSVSSKSSPPVAAPSGEALYSMKCQACHQANGAGIPGAFPPLAGSEWVINQEERLIKIVLHGVHGELTVKGSTYNGVMPAFKDNTSNEELAAVLSYIRASWANNSPEISSDSVATVREATKERTGSWNGDSELKTLE